MTQNQNDDLESILNTAPNGSYFVARNLIPSRNTFLRVYSEMYTFEDRGSARKFTWGDPLACWGQFISLPDKNPSSYCEALVVVEEKGRYKFNDYGSSITIAHCQGHEMHMFMDAVRQSPYFRQMRLARKLRPRRGFF